MNPVDHDYLKYYKIPEGALLVDIGASVGEWGDEILPELKRTNSHLVCMEPAPWCLGHLSSWLNQKAFGYASILSTAITWNQDGIEGMKIADSYLISHLANLPGQPMARWGGKTVRVDPIIAITLETLVRVVGRDIDMVKMDIESAEVPVLFGCPDEVFDHVKNFTIAAYHEYQGRKTWEILQPFLEHRGYKCIHECLPYKEFPAMDLLYATKDGSF